MKKDSFFKKAFISFFEDDVPSMAAQLAFYINVAFFPFVVFMFIIISTTPLLSEENLYDLCQIRHLCLFMMFCIMYQQAKALP